MKKYTEEFDSALRSVTQERGEIYGHPLDDFSTVALIKSVNQACHDPALRHVLDMIAVKMVRLLKTPEHLDSWIDIAGYARTACMVIDKRDERNPKQ